jgi:hypothetical protein
LAYYGHTDLPRTTAKGPWWQGRTLLLRIHLGAFVLQWLSHLTDRHVHWASRIPCRRRLRGFAMPGAPGRPEVVHKEARFGFIELVPEGHGLRLEVRTTAGNAIRERLHRGAI